jgi:hypothetical protein
MLPLEYRSHRGGWPTFRQLFLFPEVSEGAPAGVRKAGFPSEQKGREMITRRSARVTFHKANENDNWNQTFRYKLILSPALS